MASLDCQRCQAISQHVEDEDRVDKTSAERGMSRRSFLQQTMTAGLGVGAASAILAACTDSANTPATKPSSTIDLITTWDGDEQTSFKKVTAPFEQSNRVTINIEATRDLDTILTTRLKAHNPPDIAILPNPGKMQELAAQNKLLPLSNFVDMNQLQKDYNESWIDLGTYQNNLYAIFYKVANKGTVWYNPTQFQKNNYETPRTWDEMLTLSSKIAQKQQYPWSLGVENGAASGWPAADWVAEIFLNQSGPVLYDQWVEHKIPWTHSSVKDAFTTFGQVLEGRHFINGAPQSILTTGFEQVAYDPYSDPPRAYMFYMGDFAEGFITRQYPNARAGTDFNFFRFPTINPRYSNAITGGADVVVVMKDNSAVRALVKYLATAEAQTIWVKRGGFTSPNRSVDLNAYPNEVAKASAQMLTSAQLFKYGAGDLMPSAVQDAFWRGMLTFIDNPRQLDSVLKTIEVVANKEY